MACSIEPLDEHTVHRLEQNARQSSIALVKRLEVSSARLLLQAESSHLLEKRLPIRLAPAQSLPPCLLFC